MGAMQTFKAAVCGPSAMKSYADIIAERRQIKSKLSLQQIEDLQIRLNFDEELNKIILTELSRGDIAACAMFGILTAFIAQTLDRNGKAIETFINTLQITDPSTGDKVSIRAFDTNNIFDIKRGTNHREQLFHSGNLFKKAPADFVKPDGFSLEELMGQSKSEYSLLEIMTKHYGLNGGFLKIARNIIKIYGVHFSKDIVTPAGLPLPFSDVFTKFTKNDSNACGYSTSNALYDGFLKEVNKELHFLNVRASDISSAVLIGIFTKVFVKIVHPELDKRQQKSLVSKMTVVTTAMLIISQMLMLSASWTKCGKVVDGGKLNLIAAQMLIANSFKICIEANKNHSILMGIYKKRQMIIEEELLNAD
ncbi:MAG: hypothetical protein FWG90_02470 [Oscillospiraceae bacterium]|nr:hypothetical protein [Oscillospiraceae bacterium]